jgi:3-phosphoshikimate 1-carboxyvinyltransferase
MNTPGRNVIALHPLLGPNQAEVSIPGSKSYTIRALLLAALTSKPDNQPIRVLKPLISDDTQAIMNCLNTLGIRTDLKQNGTDRWIAVYGNLGDIRALDTTLDANLSAATLRFLLALAAVIPGRQTLLGREGLNKRPVKDLVESLRVLGASIEYLDREGYPPVRVNSSTLKTDTIHISGSTSSQYISALMMIAPLIQTDTGTVAIELPGEPVSKPYLDMTMSIMEAFGVTVVNEDYCRFLIKSGQSYQAESYTVEPDASSMAYFLAITALTGSTITIPDINPDSAQADMRFVDILQSMGNRVEINNNRLTLHGRGVEPLHVNMQDCPDQAQTLAVLAAFADGETRIDGLQSLRVKETDRIAAVVQELAKMGIRTEEAEDALVIHGGNPQPARIDTYGDHRMAMSFAVAGALLKGMEIDDPEVVNKTYPEFWTDLKTLGVDVTPVEPTANQAKASACKIVLTGFMGAGKSSVAAILAKTLGLELVEMDDLIVQRSGRSSVTEIFEQDGETRFRELEEETARSLQGITKAVISTGGGIVMNKLAMDYLSLNGTVVLLEAQLETVLERLAGSTDRPLLKHPAKVQSLYELRLPLYRHYAQVHVTTDDQTPEALAQRIIQAVQQTNQCTV